MVTKKYVDKKVAILGLSVEGEDSTQFFLDQGAAVSCFDVREQADIPHFYELFKDRVTFFLGPSYLSHLVGFDFIVRTPGMKLGLAPLERAKTQGALITSLTRIFMEHCAAPIIGVTGTKGKGTTTTLIGELLKASGFTTYIGGNVGMPLLTKLNQIQKKDRVVLELSSFQLEDLTVSPHVGVVLMITQDHLVSSDPHAGNYHDSREAYIAAKMPLLKFQTNKDFAILNADNETSSSFAQVTEAKKYWFSKDKAVTGAYIEGDTLQLSIGEKQIICKTKDFSLLGKHNYENIAAAAIAAYVSGATVRALRQVIPQFRGLEHRLEFVTEKKGVFYYNDSFSTVPETSIAAIQAFTEPMILIAGGADKGSDYKDLGETIVSSSVKALILIGDMAENIKEAVDAAAKKQQKKPPKIIWKPKNMAEIVQQAKQLAETGDVVVLSPACASFGMFKNYKERGLLFKKYVQES